MRLDVRTILVPIHPDGRQFLLLQRSPQKKLFPNLITGIGGAVELEQGEGANLEAAALRELTEETQIPPETLHNLRIRLTTHLVRGQDLVILLWLTAHLTRLPENLSSPDGQLAFYPRQKLPLPQMVPTAREAIAFLARLGAEDERCYCGTYGPDQVRLILNA